MRSPLLGVAQLLTALIIVLAAVASAGGLLMSGLYRETDWTVPQVKGQDLVTLLTLPLLGWMLLSARRGSARGTMAWIGLLGYLFYTYTGAAFSYAFNEFFLIYVALFSLSIAALVAAIAGLDAGRLQRTFDEQVPRRPVALFLILLALMLATLWLGQIIPFLTMGTVPELIARANTPTNFVYVLDLGIVVPLALLSAYWLWHRQPWGDLLAGCVLIKATTMGLALLSMSWFALRAGQLTDPGLAIVWIVLTVSSLGMSIWFFRHCATTAADLMRSAVR